MCSEKMEKNIRAKITILIHKISTIEKEGHISDWNEKYSHFCVCCGKTLKTKKTHGNLQNIVLLGTLVSEV